MEHLIKQKLILLEQKNQLDHEIETLAMEYEVLLENLEAIAKFDEKFPEVTYDKKIQDIYDGKYDANEALKEMELTSCKIKEYETEASNVQKQIDEIQNQMFMENLQVHTLEQQKPLIQQKIQYLAIDLSRQQTKLSSVDNELKLIQQNWKPVFHEIKYQNQIDPSFFKHISELITTNPIESCAADVSKRLSIYVNNMTDIVHETNKIHKSAMEQQSLYNDFYYMKTQAEDKLQSVQKRETTITRYISSLHDLLQIKSESKGKERSSLEDVIRSFGSSKKIKPDVSLDRLTDHITKRISQTVKIHKRINQDSLAEAKGLDEEIEKIIASNQAVTDVASK